MRELRLEVPLGATVDDAWDAVVEIGAGARARTGVAAVRGQRHVRRPGHDPRRRRRGRLHPAGERRRPADDRLRILEIHAERVPRRPRRDAQRAAGDGRGRGRRRVHRPDACDAGDAGARARRTRPRATPAGASTAWSTRRSSRWRWRVLEAIADEIEARFGVRRLAIVHRSGAVPLGDASVDRGRRRAAPGRRVRGRALRDRRDEGAGADLEGRAVHRRPRLGRPRRADRCRAARGLTAARAARGRLLAPHADGPPTPHPDRPFAPHPDRPPTPRPVAPRAWHAPVRAPPVAMRSACA